jgi:hypothetical protein
MPYARRRVSAVFPPGAAADGPAFMKTHYRLRTVPAPWTAEEQWRDHRHGDDPDDDYVEENKVVFEKELATLAEPAELDIWINPAGLEGASADSMVSLGLRARWAELSDGTYRWWIVRLKDCRFYPVDDLLTNRRPTGVLEVDRRRAPGVPRRPQGALPRRAHAASREGRWRRQGQGQWPRGINAMSKHLQKLRVAEQFAVDEPAHPIHRIHQIHHVPVPSLHVHHLYILVY